MAKSRNGHGGRRPGAGRKPGSVNKAKLEAREAAAAKGITPLDHMLAVLNDPNEGWKRKDAMAVAAAPYLHPRLSNVEHSGEIARPTVIRAPSVAASVEEWEAAYVPAERH